MADGLHLLPRYRENVEAILRRQLPGVEVWAYGSRVDGTCYDGSDLDLALRAPGLAKTPYSQLRGLPYALRESTIPIIVDVRWATMPESYQREIERLYVVLVPGSESAANEPSQSPASPIDDGKL